ncbi:MAG: SDR family NAD(P)-dependent oxidoreductase [Thermoleophilaceae bacterium]
MRNAVVTGASSGIGEATARRLARDGWKLLLIARREDRLQSLAKETGGSYLAVDLVDDGAPAKVKARVEEDFGGRLDLVVNNAGAGWRAAFGDTDEGGYANVRKTMDLNFDAVVRLTEALLPILRSSAPSAIVNVSSVAGRVARPRTGAYSASKFALTGWSEALHFEEREHGVHVGVVYPGFISTEGFPQEGLKRNPLTRRIVGKPDDVAGAIVRAAGGKPEVIVPRYYAVVPKFRMLVPRFYHRAGIGSPDR